MPPLLVLRNIGFHFPYTTGHKMSHVMDVRDPSKYMDVSSVPARTLVMGVPARIVRVLTEAELREKVEATNRYCELAAASLATVRRIDMPIGG